MRGWEKRRVGGREGEMYGEGTEGERGGTEYGILTRNCGNYMVPEPNLTVSVIRPNWNFRFSNMGGDKSVKTDKKVNICVDSWHAAYRMRTFKSKPHLYLQELVIGAQIAICARKLL